MAGYSIIGGREIRGEVNIQGSKNSVLPIIAASILNKGKTYLHNCPNISDVQSMINILKSIGCKVSFSGNELEIDSHEIVSNRIPVKYVKEMRSSIIVLGAVLGRLKSVNIAYPGGCSIGKRPIDYHIQALETMNVNFTEKDGVISCKTKKIYGSSIHLFYPSVGATENVILSAVLAEGVTHIFNAALEPEIVELQCFLNQMGAKVTGCGTNHIKIVGVNTLNDVKYAVRGDRIVAGTYMAGAAITGGEMVIHGMDLKDIKAILDHFNAMGCYVKTYRNQSVMIKGIEKLNPIGIVKTKPFPGFPTDMQAIIMACLSVSRGASIIYENIFENRYKHVNEMIKLGADIITKERCALVRGVDELHGANVRATDLRGGASLIISALKAKGQTNIYNISHIERGYESIIEDFNQFGGLLKRFK